MIADRGANDRSAPAIDNDGSPGGGAGLSEPGDLEPYPSVPAAINGVGRCLKACKIKRLVDCLVHFRLASGHTPAGNGRLIAKMNNAIIPCASSPFDGSFKSCRGINGILNKVGSRPTLFGARGNFAEKRESENRFGNICEPGGSGIAAVSSGLTRHQHVRRAIISDSGLDDVHDRDTIRSDDRDRLDAGDHDHARGRLSRGQCQPVAIG
ncbi:hypothetical protein RPMA_26690 [Tardiphaga alba]|uniref:Uncharacterized protein n=1 Tax=Tardiphaga alba TaxID=340268 RepID=A0ABX8AEB8_9BRAD|nr:hypothetical protein [Tardiphaga alba]QUS42013.1 hypothetical protein RPMA_26690 [Tardiphaga alba]